MVAVWRRIADAVGGISDREWALLGVEMLGVIAGILIAFELESWSEGRRERIEQRLLLERLLEESEQTVAELREHRDSFATIRDEQLAVADKWINGRTCPTLSDWRVLSQAAKYPALWFPRAAYDEMIGSGGLARLPTPEVRKAVSAFHAAAEHYSDQLDYFRNGIHAEDFKFDFGERAAFDPKLRRFDLKQVDLQRACADRAYQLATIRRVRNFHVMHEGRSDVVSRAISMCGQIARAVGRQCRPASGKPLTGKDLVLVSTVPR